MLIRSNVGLVDCFHLYSSTSTTHPPLLQVYSLERQQRINIQFKEEQCFLNVKCPSDPYNNETSTPERFPEWTFLCTKLNPRKPELTPPSPAPRTALDSCGSATGWPAGLRRSTRSWRQPSVCG